MNGQEAGKQKSAFPLRLLLLYALLVGVYPTIVIWADFDDTGAAEQDWDHVIVLSVLASIPLVVASWAGIRNIRRVPFLAIPVILFTGFHLWTTGMACMNGLMGEPYSDPGLDGAAFAAYAKFFVVFSVPFLAALLIWRLWPKWMKA